ncbi:glycosyltransferase [Candidatus Binatia bacterium]|nr:glycosyltransferase [Candidatus Binatia bacterium]
MLETERSGAIVEVGPDGGKGAGPPVAPPFLSIVAPVHNEAAVVRELVERCAAAARRCAVSFEVVIVDDASTDDTASLLASLAADPCVRTCRLPANVGQFRATQVGLRDVRGQSVIVLDGDLQDPPEAIPRLVAALSTGPRHVLAVQAVKDSRDDPLPMMIGQRLFHWMQHVLSGVAVARGAGSYCIMRRSVVRRVAMADLAHANLAAVLAVVVHALGGEVATISYAKGARYDRRGRVGWMGLAAEAVESLAVTGALSRLLGGGAILLGLGGLVLGGSMAMRAALLAAAVLTAGAALGSRRRARRAVAAGLAVGDADG